MVRGNGMTGGPPPSGEESVLARTAGFAAAKGAGLIAVAVLVGVLLLQVVDDGSTGPVGATGDDKPSATTTTEKPSTDKTTTTTTADVVQEKSPDQVRVVVLNGGAIAGAAGTMSTSLTEKGYTNQEPANDDDTTRTGNAVHCRAGMEREAAALAVAVGEGTTVEDFPDPAPPHSDGVDCVVVVGS